MSELKKLDRWEDALALRPVSWERLWNGKVIIGILSVIFGLGALLGGFAVAVVYIPKIETSNDALLVYVGAIATFGAFALTFFGGMSLLHMHFPSYCRQCSEIWRRNVIGYELWITQESRDSEAIYYLGRRHALRSQTDRIGPIIVVLPMGGWLAKPWQSLARETDCRPRTNMLKWRLLGFRMTGGTYTPIELHLADQCGDRIWMNLSTFVDMIFETWEGGKLLSSLGDWIEHTHRWRKSAERDREDFAKKVEFLREILGKVRKGEVSRLFKAIDRIEATKRFVKSKDGMKIRLWLIEELLEILPKDDINRPSFEAELESAERASSPASMS